MSLKRKPSPTPTTSDVDDQTTKCSRQSPPLSSGTSATGKTKDGRPKRIEKKDLYLFMAWWMEFSPWAHKPEDLNKMGVVIMRQNHTILAVDCTRKDNVHPIQYLLAKHQEASKGSDLYLSRPPCANCTKSIVQAKVSKVYHLPFKPELETDEDRASTANLFAVNSVGVSVMVPSVPDEIYERSKDTNLFGPVRSYETSGIFDQYQVDEGTGFAIDKDRLDTMEDNLKGAKLYLDLKTIQQVGDDIQFQNIKNKTILAAKKHELALHSSRMANLLAPMTDDPKTGVGVVLLKGHDLKRDNLDLFEYVGIGWNGYPMGAQFEDYPKGANKSGESLSQRKYEFIIHAEYNAALFRNTSTLAGCYSYATRRPCDACFPLWEKFGIKEAYYPKKVLNEYKTKPKELSMDCYETVSP